MSAHPHLFSIAIGFAALTIVGAAVALIWFYRSRSTTSTSLDDQTIVLLARAFDQAWDRYLDETTKEPDEKSKRAELAKHIVAMAKSGERDEDSLSMKGYMRLRATHSVTIRSGRSEASGGDETSQAKSPP
jgi:hypothetical protein